MSDSEELTRIRLENVRLQYAVGVLETENARLRVMLETALRTKSREVDVIAKEAIRKARGEVKP